MSIPEVTALEAFEALEAYRVIDVRQEHEFHGPLGRIGTAEHVPLASVKDRADELRGNLPLLLVCRSGMRSGKACATLVELGRADITNLAGGMIGWNNASLPVLYHEPESLAALVEQLVAWTAQVGPLTADEVRANVHERFAQQAVQGDAPTQDAVEELIGFVGASLASAPPPDLELSLASFQRSLRLL